MSIDSVRKYCSKIYAGIYEQTTKELLAKFAEEGNVSEKQVAEIERVAQKEAIKETTIKGMRKYPNVEAALIWRIVYEMHIHRKSSIADFDIIQQVISADQSWKKSSGHAFEEMIKLLGTFALKDSGIEIILQRDLNTLIKAGELHNEPRDISWLKEQIDSSVFDLYAIIHTDEGETFCFGCIQSKTSIRDRVTRDREPSIHAMQSFFWSIVVVLDGDFLKNPKFVSMVEGGTSEFPDNGWHGMYVFSKKHRSKRVYPVDLDLKNFAEHAILAAKKWLKQRQWLDNKWIAG